MTKKYTLNEITFVTPNLEEMVNFYGAVFDIDFETFWLGEFVYYRGFIGQVCVTISPANMLGIQSPKSRYHLSFSVPDLEQAITLANNNGGIQLQVITVYPTERYCAVLDPDGNSIELVETI